MERWRAVSIKICAWLAALLLTAMMLLTVVDVTARAVLNLPIRGTFDLIELLLAGTFFLALPAVFLREDNIVVTVVDDIAPRRVPALDRAALVLSVVVLAAMTWQGALAARDTYEFNDVTADLGLPRVLHWAAVLFGLGGATIAAFAMACRRGRQS
jgi:TRAP-type C4-dicarboxylate transport system permease small subunit